MAKKKKSIQQTQVMQRLDLIMKVQQGLMTASDAAKLLNVSRKTYYKWEARALEAMMGALKEKEPGRPPPSQEALEVQKLKKELEQKDRRIDFLDRKYELKELIDDFFRSTASSASEKK